MLTTIAQAIASVEGTIFASTLIVLVAGFAYVRFRGAIRRLRTPLAEATKRIEASGDESGFAASFFELDEHFSQHPLLGDAWAEFADSLVQPRPDASRQVLRNPHHASEYFHLSSITGDHINLRLYQAVPGYLTGLGILGTFIGLVAGIYLAGGGLAASSSEDARRALSYLLSGASVAFLTSVAGLLSSLLFSVAEKRAAYDLDKLVAAWNGSLDRRLERVTQEQLMAEQLHEAIEQRKQLERFNTDLAISIATALEERLNSRFSPGLNTLVTELQGLRGQQTEFGKNLVTAVTSNVREVSGAAGDQMRELAETMGGLVHTLRESVGVLATGQAEMVQSFQGVVRRLESGYSESASALTSEMKQAFERLAGVLESAGAAASRDVKTAGDDLARTVAQVAGQLLEQMERAGGAAAGQLTHASTQLTADVTAAGAKAGSALSAAASESAQALTSAAAEAAKVFRDSSALVGVNASKFNDAASRVEALQSGNTAAMSELQTMLRDFREAHGAFRASVQPLAEAVATLRTVSTSLEAQVSAGRDVHGAFAAAAASIKVAQDQMHTTWRQYEDRFAGMDEALGAILTDLTQSAKAHSDVVKDLVMGLDSSFGKSLGQLSGVLGDLDDAIQAFGRVNR